MDVIAGEMGFDMTPYVAYMNTQANMDRAEKSALHWRTQVQSGNGQLGIL